MAVKVQVQKPVNGAVVRTHEEGVNFLIENGHLIITGDDRGDSNVAIYAPGTWVSAEIKAK